MKTLMSSSHFTLNILARTSYDCLLIKGRKGEEPCHVTTDTEASVIITVDLKHHML
jgi:hypothetical protein